MTTSTSDRGLLRRQFLTTAALAPLVPLQMPAAAATNRVPWVSDRVRIGVIGTGVRGKYLIANLPPSVDVIAICDCAASRMASTLNPQEPFAKPLAAFRELSYRCKTYYDYRRLIDQERLDAVIIATPDHHHVQAALLAVQAGLDVYLEKPLSVTVQEGRVLADAVKQTGRVLQVGSQQRTMEINRFGCEFIRRGGLGRIKKVDLPNYPGPLAVPPLDAEPVPAGMAWKLFLGPAPQRAYNRKLWMKEDFRVGDLLWRGWDLFRDYSGHLMTNWGAHSIDMVQYALGMDDSGPVRIGLTPGVSASLLQRDWDTRWREKTPAPQSWADSRFQPLWMEYANGTTLHFVPGTRAAVFHGEHGRAEISRNQFRTDPPDLIRDAPDSGVAEKWSGVGHVARPHLENWLDCMHSRGVPNAPVEVGHRTATVCHLAGIVRELQRDLTWDPVLEQFPGDAPANQRLTRQRHDEFELPTAHGQVSLDRTPGSGVTSG